MRRDRQLLESALNLIAKYHAREEVLVDLEKSVIEAISSRLNEPDPEEPYPMCFWDGDDKPGSVRFDKQTEQHKHPLYTRFQLEKSQ